MSNHPTFEALSIGGPASATVTALGVPEALLARWDLASSHQVRTAFVLRHEGAVAGVALGVHRPLTSYEKLAGVWLADGHADRARELIDRTIAHAAAGGAVAVKLDVDPRSVSPLAAVVAAADDLGLTAVTRPVLGAAYPAEGTESPDGRAWWLDGYRPPRHVPYYRQSTEFTCGPVAVGMALAAGGDHRWQTREAELTLWREANTLLGCDPFGLAVAAARRDARPAVRVSVDGPILLESARGDWDRDTREFIQRRFRAEAAQLDLDTRLGDYPLSEVVEHVASGGLAVVLIDEYPMHAEHCPHWIVVHHVAGADADGAAVVVVNDPWTDDHLGETWLDAADLPLPVTTLQRLAAWGDPSYSAVLLFAGAATPPAAGD